MNITPGHILRQIPRGSTVGPQFVAMDIAQDVILTRLHGEGLFEGDGLVFKGGTALRKLFAGDQGRFSTDLDFALADIQGDRATLLALLIEILDGFATDEFTFAATNVRGRPAIAVQVTAAEAWGVPAALPDIKVDVGPPTWLEAPRLPFVPNKLHDRYGFDLPELPCMAMMEIAAEKVARLCHRATARDASDLVWLAHTPPYSGLLNRGELRRLAVLKVWVDNHGLDGHWRPANAPGTFSPDVLLQEARAWDDEQIGLLTHPPPQLLELEAALRGAYAELAELSSEEAQWAVCDRADEAAVVQAVAGLDGARWTAEDIWGAPRT